MTIRPNKLVNGVLTPLSDAEWTEYQDRIDNPPQPSTNPDDYPLTAAQFKALVNYLDKDAAIRAAIAQTADALQRAWLLSRYENAESYNHGDPFLQSMRAAIGMSEADLAAAWMLAKDLKSGE